MADNSPSTFEMMASKAAVPFTTPLPPFGLPPSLFETRRSFKSNLAAERNGAEALHLVLLAFVDQLLRFDGLSD